jgi:penicillin-binding protein 1A
MVRAVAKRPVEKFDIEVALPDWEMEPDEEAWFGEPENGSVIPGDPGMMVDPDGNPIAPQPGQPSETGPQPLPAPTEEPRREELNQEWLDRAVGREKAPPAAPRQAPPRQLSARDPVERRPVPAQP